jgi:beta-1,4-mannosyl-glycoprotein beta-1,4-N-acetylglucosaminyltransferase
MKKFKGLVLGIMICLVVPLFSYAGKANKKFSSKSQKIYDCFLFFNELDRLEIRLEELNSVVDYFVLVEATETHQGRPKPLYFKENKDRFKKFLDKIIHVVVDFSIIDKSKRGIWTLESYQRAYIKEGLKEKCRCRPNDVIFVSDVDQIPKAEAVIHASKLLRKNKNIRLAYLSLKWFHIFFNGHITPYSPEDKVYYKDFPHTFAGLWSYMGKEGLDYNILHHKAREIIYTGRDGQRSSIGEKVVLIPNAGWHFSFTGGAEKLVEKTYGCSDQVVHTSVDDEFTTKEFWENLIREKRSYLSSDEFEVIPVDDTFPKFVRDNVDRYIQKGLVCSW